MSHEKNYRKDIDGLRAIAVLAVVFYHAFPNLVRGGFIGVDIFFVISGYLISTIIFKKLDAQQFSFQEFYIRRIHRIFPALLLVIFCSLVFGFFALYQDEFARLGKHSVAGILFYSNFAYLLEASDYFNILSEQKPLLHLWSLGIEEQFYILWPLLVFLFHKRGWKLSYLILSVLIGSFVFNIYQTKVNSAYAFFLPTSRFWELLLGTSLAWIQLYSPRSIALFQRSQEKGTDSNSIGKTFLTRILPDLLSASGIVLLVLGLSIITKETAFPGYAALLPTLGTFLVILAGKDTWLNRNLLGSKVPVFIGQISYPLYLWHWPLFSFVSILESSIPRAEVKWIALALSFLLSILTWKIIESKVRFNFKPKITYALVIISILFTITGYIVFASKGKNFNGKDQGLFPSQKYTQFMLERYECRTDFSKILNAPLPACNYSITRPNPTVALIGDSHADHFYYGLFEHFTQKYDANINVLELAAFGCPALYGVNRHPNPKECALIDSIYDYLTASKEIQTVILSDRGTLYVQDDSIMNSEKYTLESKLRPDLKSNLDIYRFALNDSIERLLNANKNVIIVVDTPELDFSPDACGGARPVTLPNHKKKDPCAMRRSTFEKRANDYHTLVRETVEKFPKSKIKVWEPWKALCDKEWCWAAKEGILFYRDYNHLNPHGSEKVSEVYD